MRRILTGTIILLFMVVNVQAQDTKSIIAAIDKETDKVIAFYQASQFAKAEVLAKEILEKAQNALGSDHPITLRSMNNLAVMYRNQGKFTLAEPLYKRLLAAVEKVLGPSHSNTLKTVNNLAVLYMEQKRYELAEPLFRRVLTTLKKTRGDNHPRTRQAQKVLNEFLKLKNR